MQSLQGMRAFDHNQPERMTPQKRSEMCYDLRECTCAMWAYIQIMIDNHSDRKEQVLWFAKEAADGVSRLLRDAGLEAEGRPSSEYRAAFLRKPTADDQERLTPQERSDMCRNLLDCIEAVPIHIESGELEKARRLTDWVFEGVGMLLRDARMDAEGTPDYKPSCCG
jgi:hypothetical protein